MKFYLVQYASKFRFLLMFSAGIDTRLANKKRFPSLVRMLPSQNVAYAQCLEALFRTFHWSTIYIICDPDSTTDYFYYTMCTEVPNAMDARGSGQYLYYVLPTNLSRSDLMTSALLAAKTQSRGLKKHFLSSTKSNVLFTFLLEYGTETRRNEIYWFYFQLFACWLTWTWCDRLW